MIVGPCFDTHATWWTSVTVSHPQPGNRHPLSRRRISRRCASVGSRPVPLVEAGTIGSVDESRMCALQASRRATSAEIGPAPSSEAGP